MSKQLGGKNWTGRAIDPMLRLAPAYKLHLNPLNNLVAKKMPIIR